MKVEEDKRIKQFSFSWRREITANKMRGIASLRSESESEDFSFRGRSNESCKLQVTRSQGHQAIILR